MHPKELPGDMGLVEPHFFPYGHSFSVGLRKVHGLHQTYHQLRNHFGRTRWYSLVTRLKWKLISVHLEIVLIFRQDKCMVCIERIIGSKIILDASDGTPRWGGSSRISLLSIWRQCYYRCKIGALFALDIGWEMILDAPDGTTRWRGWSGSSFQSVLR